MLDLLEGLHPLGDNFQAHVASKAYQRVQDGGGITFSSNGINKHLVNLDEVDAELEHVGQPAVTGAEIIDPDTQTEALQCGDHAARRGEILERLALSHFEQHLGQRDRRAAEDRRHVLDDCLVHKVPRRQVEADGEMRSRADCGTGLGTDAPHQRARQWHDQAGRFSKRNEVDRRHQRTVGLAPADKHLRADDARGREIQDRLVVGNELIVLDRARELVDRIAARAPGPEGHKRKDQHPSRAGADCRHRDKVAMRGQHTPARDRCCDHDAEVFRRKLHEQQIARFRIVPLRRAPLANNRAV